MTSRWKWALMAFLITWLPGCHYADPRIENRANFELALRAYLSAHGDMCLGKFDWPVDVSKRDMQAKSANSLQLPVMQKLGLVSVQQIDGQGQPGMRYQLTDAGRKFYLRKPMQSPGPQGSTLHHDGDLCYGHMQLDQIIGWDRAQLVDGRPQIVLTYTYRSDTAPWAKNAEVRQVFPVLARMVESAGTLQLRQSFRLNDDGWVGVPATRY